MVLGYYFYHYSPKKQRVMEVRDRSIGSNGLEQGGPNLGNDYSRDITREVTSDDPERIIIPKKDKDKEKEEQDKGDKNQQQR
jgi:hypothetical protein